MLMSTSQTSILVEKAAEFHDDVADVVEIFGGNLHCGYWWNDDDRTPFPEAMNRLTDIVGDKLGLRPGSACLTSAVGQGCRRSGWASAPTPASSGSRSASGGCARRQTLSEREAEVFRSFTMRPPLLAINRGDRR